MFDMIVIGGGPAGLSAASYTLGRGLKVAMVYDKMGGKVGWSQTLADLDEKHRLPGYEVVRLLSLRTAEQHDWLIADHAAEVTRDPAGFAVSTANHGVLRSATVIIATGAAAIQLNVPGAQRFFHHGLGYSVQTHAHLVAGKRVAVIGVTPRTMRGAAELTRTAERLYVITPHTSDLAQPLLPALRQRPNVEVLAGYSIEQVVGHTSLEQIVVERDGEKRVVPVEYAFVDLGLSPNSGLVRTVAALDAHGAIIVDADGATTG